MTSQTFSLEFRDNGSDPGRALYYEFRILANLADGTQGVVSRTQCASPKELEEEADRLIRELERVKVQAREEFKKSRKAASAASP